MPESAGRDLLHPSERDAARAGAGSTATLLVVLSLLFGVVGGLSLSQATMGVGLLAAACLLAILARIAQASEYHRQHRPR